MDGNLNPFAVLNKQGHIIDISMGIYQLRYAMRYVFLSHKWAYFSSFLIQKSF